MIKAGAGEIDLSRVNTLSRKLEIVRVRTNHRHTSNEIAASNQKQVFLLTARACYLTTTVVAIVIRHA